MPKKQTSDNQSERFKRAARDADADMSKEEFGRVIGGLAKSKPEEKTGSDQSDNDQSG